MVELVQLVALTAALGSLAGVIRWLIDNDPDLGRALRFEIPPWA